MDFLRCKKVSDHDVAEELKKRMEFTDYQKSKLRNVLEDLPFYFIEFEKPPKSHPLFRLTAPLYLLFHCLLVIAMPFKWLFTGKSYYEYESNIMKFLRKWKDLLSF